MKIAYVCMDKGVPVFGWRKGCSVHVQEMLRAFKQLGHDVTLFATTLGGEPPQDLRDIDVRHIKIATRGLERADREQLCWEANERLSAMLQAEGPFDLIYERYSLWSYAGMEHAIDYDVHGVLEVNAPLIEEQTEYRGLINSDLALEAISRCVANASLVAAVSDEVGQYIRRFPGANVQVISNGVDPARFMKASDLAAWPQKQFTVGFVGSLKAWHGVDRLLDAYAICRTKAPYSRLLIVGDGPERASLEAQIDRLGLASSVTMVGAVNPEQIPDYLHHMDVGVAPYPALDSFYFSPMKVYEYMAAGLPVVVSDIGQLRQLVADEVNGLVCPAGNAAAIADALMCLCRDPALRRRLGKNGRQKVLQQYTWFGIAQRVIDLAAQSNVALPYNGEKANGSRRVLV